MKIHSFYLLLIAVLLLQLQHCKKDSSPDKGTFIPNSVWGKVIDKTTGQGVSHAKVYLYNGQRTILGNPSWTFQGTQYSDTSGNFYFSAKQDDNLVWRLYATKDLFFDDGNNEKLIASNEVGYAVQVPLQPLGWLKFHVKNVSPFNDADEISFSSPWGGGLVHFMEKTLTLCYLHKFMEILIIE